MGIRLAGLKSTEMTFGNPWNREKGRRAEEGPWTQPLMKAHNTLTHTRVQMSCLHRRVPKRVGTHRFNIKKLHWSDLNWRIISTTKWLFHLM